MCNISPLVPRIYYSAWHIVNVTEGKKEKKETERRKMRSEEERKRMNNRKMMVENKTTQTTPKIDSVSQIFLKNIDAKSSTKY